MFPASFPATAWLTIHRLPASRKLRRPRLVPEVLPLESRTLLSINIQFDYSLDTNHFFDDQARRAALQAAADTIASQLDDSLLAIQPSGGDTWSESFYNPSAGQLQTVSNPIIPANTLIIYVGARPMANTEDALGKGGPGVWSGLSGDQTWINTVEARGQLGALASPPSDFGPWGGSIAFDNSSSTDWYFGQDTSGLAPDQVDFFTVAEHELGHVLGIGTSPSWSRYVSGGSFDGPAAEAAYGGQPVPLDTVVAPGYPGAHWASGTTSDGQLAIMNAQSTLGDRRYFTPLDFAGLTDIGWNFQAAAPVFQLAQSSLSVPEDVGSLLVTVTRNGGYTPATVRYATSDGTAKAGTDYSSVSGTLNFAFGQTVATFTVPILDNPAPGGDLTFNISLSDPGGNAILGSPNTSTVTLLAVPTTTATTLTASTPVAVYGQPVTFMATVVARAPSTATPTGGTVTFKDGTTTLGTAPLNSGVATFTTSLDVGAHSIVAVYGGNGSQFRGSTSTTGPTSLISTVAGTGTGTDGYNGDGGQATAAEFYEPTGVAVDAAGNLFIADTGNSVIRKVSPAGIITTVAGTGTQGYSGDGGPATAATLNLPWGVAVDGAGDLFIADSFNNVIREVSPAGIITTVAGNGKIGYSGDGGLARNATFFDPRGVAVDAVGDLFIADTYNDVIRKVSPSGLITTVAGTGTQGYSGDGGPATAATLDGPWGVAVDTTGNLFIADLGNRVIRKVSPAGVITTVAGTGTQGYSGDGGPATAATLNAPWGVAVDTAGNFFIADRYNDVIREVSPAGIITTDAGTGTQGYSGDGGPAPAAKFHEPTGVAVDAAGDLFIADGWSDAVRRVTAGLLPMVAVAPTTVAMTASTTTPLYGQAVTFTASVSAAPSAATPSGGIVTFKDGETTLGTVPLNAGTASFTTAALGVGAHAIVAVYSGDGAHFGSSTFGPTGPIYTAVGTGAVASNPNPQGLAMDAAGNLFIAEVGYNDIRKVSSNGIISTVAGPFGMPSDPLAVAVDALGNVFIADFGSSVIRKVNPAGVISIVAGTGSAGYSGDGGPATDAQLDCPAGVAVDAAGDLFIADYGNSVVRKVSPAGVISTVLPGWWGNPYGLAVDAAGDLFIAYEVSSVIRKMTPTGVISTVAGNGTWGYSGDGGLATSAALNQPTSVAVDAAGDLFISDTGNQVIRKVSPAGVITTVAGTGTQGYSGDGGPATAATFRRPIGVAVDAAGELFIADANNNVIRAVAPGLLLTVTTTNQPPVLTAIADQTVTQGGTVALTAQATDPDPGETLTFSLDAGAPAGASINPGSGAFFWAVPTTLTPGDYPVTVRVTDNGSPPLSATQTFTIHVFAIVPPPVNQPPLLAAIADQTVVQGGTVTIAARATDPDPGQTLTFSLSTAPPGALINTSTGAFSWTIPATQAPGDYPVTVRVTDNGSPPLSAAQTFIIHVQPQPPRIIGGQVRTIKVSKKKAQTVIVLNVSGSIDPASAQNLANYRLGLPGKDKKFGTKDDRLTKLSSAVYNAAARTITLTPKGGSLNLSQALTLQVSGLGGPAVPSSGKCLARVTKGGVTLLAAGAASVSGSVSASAFDRLLVDGLLPQVATKQRTDRY